VGNTSASTPAGPIVAVVLFVLLFAIAVAVFILRKRAKARREEQALRWGLTRNPTSQPYGDNANPLVPEAPVVAASSQPLTTPALSS
jgi:hypothetical protein